MVDWFLDWLPNSSQLLSYFPSSADQGENRIKMLLGSNENGRGRGGGVYHSPVTDMSEQTRFVENEFNLELGCITSQEHLLWCSPWAWGSPWAEV